VRRLSEQVLPGLMDEASLKDFTLENGTMIERTEAVYASISKDRSKAACAWLIKNGYGDIVKSLVSIALPRGSIEAFKKIEKLLKTNKVAYEYTQSVHFQTLQAFVRESLEAGRSLTKEISVEVKALARIKKSKV
jgi:hypothetical protein